MSTNDDADTSSQDAKSNARKKQNFVENVESILGQVPPECFRFRGDGSIDFEKTFLLGLNQETITAADAFRFCCATNSHGHLDEIWQRIPRAEKLKLVDMDADEQYAVIFMARYLHFNKELHLVAMDPSEVYKECLRVKWYSAAARMFHFFSPQTVVREIELANLWFQALASLNEPKRVDLFELITAINTEKQFTINDQWIEMAMKAFFKTPRCACSKKLTVMIPPMAEIEEIDAWMKKWANLHANRQSAEFTEIQNHSRHFLKFLARHL